MNSRYPNKDEEHEDFDEEEEFVSFVDVDELWEVAEKEMLGFVKNAKNLDSDTIFGAIDLIDNRVDTLKRKVKFLEGAAEALFDELKARGAKSG